MPARTRSRRPSPSHLPFLVLLLPLLAGCGRPGEPAPGLIRAPPATLKVAELLSDA